MPIDFSIRDFFYPLGIHKLRRTFERTQWMSDLERLAYQQARLSAICRQAYENIPYYQQLFKSHGVHPNDINHPSDLTRLPLLTKNTIRTALPDMIDPNGGRYGSKRHSTSGTSGAPVSFYLDKHARILEFCYYWRHWSWAGYRLGDCFAELGSEFFLRRRQIIGQPYLWQPGLHRLMINSAQTSIASAKSLTAAIYRHKPLFLKGLASAVYFFALSLKEAGINDISFKAIFTNGEVLTPAYRKMAESVFHCPVLDSYGHMERTVAICQCMSGGYHVNDDYGLLELENTRSPNGDDMIMGNAVGTSLYNMAMPLIRYDIGDDIEIFPSTKRCDCGRTLPLVKAIHGRNEDTIVTPDGRFITSISIIPDFIEGIRFIQFIQESKRKLSIRVIPNDQWHEGNDAKLKYYVSGLVGSEMQIEVLTSDSEDDIVSDSSGKRRTVVSNVKF